MTVVQKKVDEDIAKAKAEHAKSTMAYQATPEQAERSNA
jgi:hypothetical protein